MTDKLTCFKAYDIRGKLGLELNEDIAYRIGRAYGQYLKPECVVVGGDVRLTSNSLKNALSDGLRDSGVYVYDIGLAGTEEIYFATSYLNIDGGIEVTASHNPIDYNGMKLVRRNSQPISGDTGLFEIRRLAEENSFDECLTGERGGYKSISTLLPYVEKLLSYIRLSNFNKKLKLVINSGNGAAGHVIDALEQAFSQNGVGIEFIKINHEPDGDFPNGIPNPLLSECRQDTIDAVKAHKADMGIAFDGDFDRCFLFDEKGNFIEGYYIVGLLAEAFLEKAPGQKIIHDPRLSWNTIDIVNKSSGLPIVSKTGHAFIKEKMREEDAIYGGEMSAHHYFRDFFYCDSGMIPWLLVAELLCVKNCSLSSLVEKRMELYPASGEINSIISDPNTAINNVLKTFETNAIKVDHIDGISVEFEQWRFNLRTSNTEPVVRLNVESKGDVTLMQEKTKQILQLLRS